MKAEELIIGDWVQIRKNYTGWTGRYLITPGELICVKEILENGVNPDWSGAEINDIIPYESFDPITLTPEILEKNGFVKIQSTMISTWICRVDRMYSMSIDINRATGNISGHFNSDVNCVRLFCPVNHVHELQHAMRLCGIEKEIVL